MRVLVVGEELAVPTKLVNENRIDGLWNEVFKRMVRCVIMGENDRDEPSFEWTVRKLIDYRWQGCRDMSQGSPTSPRTTSKACATSACEVAEQQPHPRAGTPHQSWPSCPC
jgi:hypothetical protein